MEGHHYNHLPPPPPWSLPVIPPAQPDDARPQVVPPRPPVVPPVQPVVPPVQPGVVKLVHWSHFKPDFGGNPDKDAKAYLLRTNDCMDIHASLENVKSKGSI